MNQPRFSEGQIVTLSDFRFANVYVSRVQSIFPRLEGGWMYFVDFGDFGSDWFNEDQIKDAY